MEFDFWEVCSTMQVLTERPVPPFLNASAHQSVRECSRNRLRGVLHGDVPIAIYSRVILLWIPAPVGARY